MITEVEIFHEVDAFAVVSGFSRLGWDEDVVNGREGQASRNT